MTEGALALNSVDLRVTFAGLVVRIGLPNHPWAAEIIQKNFAAFDRPGSDAHLPQLNAEISESDGRFSISGGNGEAINDVELADLLCEIESVIVPGAQILRADLAFVHAGAVGLDGRILLLVGESGTGKSTLTWALTKRGFQYCSDELAPLQIQGDQVLVYPYPHAICLKQELSQIRGYPEGTFAAGLRTHIAVAGLASGVSRDASPVTDIFLISHSARSTPAIVPLSASETAFRIYPHLLNALAHPKKGLSAVKSIAERAHGYLLRSGNPGATCELVRSTLGL